MGPGHRGLARPLGRPEEPFGKGWARDSGAGAEGGGGRAVEAPSPGRPGSVNPLAAGAQGYCPPALTRCARWRPRRPEPGFTREDASETKATEFAFLPPSPPRGRGAFALF